MDLAASKAHLFWNNFSVYTDHSSGALKPTGNLFDLALSGKGFFCVQAPDGVHYTRKGDFTLNADGVLVTRNGWPVLGEGGEIVASSKENPHRVSKFTVDERGNVSVDGKELDTLRIVEFAQAHRLQKAGNTLFRQPETGAGETPVEDVKISQGFLEISNVDFMEFKKR